MKIILRLCVYVETVTMTEAMILNTLPTNKIRRTFPSTSASKSYDKLTVLLLITWGLLSMMMFFD